LKQYEKKAPLTLVVDGVPKSEERQHGKDDGRSGSVLAIEVARLDATDGRFGRRALWELGVECDEGAEVRTLPRRLGFQSKKGSCEWESW
jgi:hypothetical protein